MYNKHQPSRDPPEYLTKSADVLAVYLAALDEDSPKVYHRSARISPLPWIVLRGKESRYRALLDTGASINLISEKSLSKFPHQRIGRMDVNLIGVGGSPVALYDWFEVTLQFLNGVEVDIPMLNGLDDKIGMILGMPFLQQIDAKLSIKDQMMYTKIGTFGFGVNREAQREFLDNHLESVNIVMDEDEKNKMVEASLRDTALSEGGIAIVRALLEEYSAVWDPNKVGLSNLFTHKFILTDDRPIRLPPRVMAKRYHEEIEKQEEEMLKQGVIEASSSPYRFWPVIVTKKDGTYRFAIDYRALNKVTVPDRYPMPRIEELFNSICDSKYFTLLDLAAGFWQIPLEPNQRHFTAFSTHHGHWQFKRMPFGVINGPATFQRWIDIILGDL